MNKTVYPGEPKREPGNGLIEEFRKFLMKLLQEQNERFYFFHDTVTERSIVTIKNALDELKNDKEMRKWLKIYLEK